MIFAIFVNAVVVLLTAVIIGILVLYVYFKKQYKYWSRKNVPHAIPEFPFGNLKLTKGKTMFSLFKKYYEESKHNRYFGLWLLDKPVLMINDLDLINKILIENNEDFGSHETFIGPDDDPTAVNLLTLNGEAHTNLKANVLRMFNISKLKGMVSYMSKCSNAMQDVLLEKGQASEVKDVMDILARYVTDATYSALFGIDINFTKNPNSIIGKKTFEIVQSGWIMKLKFFIAIYIPGLARMLKLRFISKELFSFFNKFLAQVIDERVEKNNIIKKDGLELLIELLSKGCLDHLTEKTDKHKKQEFTIEHLTVQVLTLVTAAHEANAPNMLWILYEMALNPQVQQKLRREIKAVLGQHNGEVTYEAIRQMNYLQQVMDEAVRKYPSPAVLMRACVNDFKDPDSSLMIEKGTYIIIPTSGLHRDAKYFPNPEKFDPDRFVTEKKNLIPSCAYLPFGKGPRTCIGQTFAPLLVATGLIALLSKFQFDISEEHSPNQLEFDPCSVIVAPKDKIMFKISLLDE